MVDAFLTNCRLADGRIVDIGIAGGKIAVVGEGAAASSNIAPTLDIRGDLVLPGLISAAGAQALGIADYGVAVGAAANLFTIAASCVTEAVAAHPPRRLVLFDGKVVARDESFLAVPLSIAGAASA